MLNIVNISGGKDSGCVAAWAKNNLPDFVAVFCDTGWESPITMAHLSYLEQWLGQPIIHLKAERQFADMVRHKGRFPSRKAQFCTETLKVQLCINYVLAQDDDVTVYCGKRREESDARRHTPKSDEYLKPGNGLTYRVRDARAWLEHHTADVYRPIVDWVVADVFSYAAMYGQLPNPLYKQGFARVGCFPCINAKHSEVRLIAELYPEKIEEIAALEQEVGTTFFGPDYIPARFCSKHVQSEGKGGQLKGRYVPTIRDVVAYVTEHRDQEELFTPSSCQSLYGLCE